MQKIYVLLRNDQQTGPYSLEEISKLDLKPYDLIWIEGKSAGWYYPQEIGALHPYLSFLPVKQKAVQQKKATTKAFETLPKVPQAAPRVEPLAGVPQEAYVPLRPASDNIEEKVHSQFKERQQETTAISTGTASPQTKPANRTLMVGALSVLVIGGVFAASWIMNRTSNELVSAGEKVEDLPSAADEISSTTASDVAEQQTTTSFTTGGNRLKEKTGERKTAKQKLPAVQEKKEEKTTVTVPPANLSVYETSPSTEDQRAPAADDVEESTTETGVPTEKKKKLRDKIFDLFKKKPEAQPTEEERPDNNGERSSSRREAGANLAQLVHVRFTVPNDWMMGIKGAKATLVNRSTQTIAKAVVEVLYYDDENQLLQKKTVTFSRIDGKESQTVTIPDHPTATKVDYHVLSAEGKPAA